MNELKYEQLKIIDGQLIGSILYITSLLISITIILNQRQKIIGKEQFLTEKEEQFLSLFNRIFIILLIIWFLYLNCESKKISRESNKDTYYIDLQILGTIISLVPALISLYVVSSTYNQTVQITDIENSFI